jgi:hypothetical protein
MTPEFLKRLAGALVAVLVVWLAASLIRRAGRDETGELALGRFDRQVADQASLVKGADTILFRKEGSGWTVNGYRADASAIDELLAALNDSSARSELVAESASSHERLGLDSTSARRLRVTQGTTTLVELLLGSRGNSYGSIFVRGPGADAAYQLSGNLANLADRALDDWRDKRIAAIAPESVAVVEVQTGRVRYRLTKGPSGWSIGSAAADSAAVAGLLDRFRSLSAIGFATTAQADSAHFDPADKVVRLFALGDRPLLTLSADSTASGFWVQRDGDQVIYRLDTWTMGPLAPDAGSLQRK